MSRVADPGTSRQYHLSWWMRLYCCSVGEDHREDWQVPNRLCLPLAYGCCCVTSHCLLGCVSSNLATLKQSRNSWPTCLHISCSQSFMQSQLQIDMLARFFVGLASFTTRLSIDLSGCVFGWCRFPCCLILLPFFLLHVLLSCPCCDVLDELVRPGRRMWGNSFLHTLRPW